MNKSAFVVGLEVYYDGMSGIIKFVSESYITVCVRVFQDRMRDVCIIVYPEQFDQITLAKESTK